MRRIRGYAPPSHPRPSRVAGGRSSHGTCPGTPVHSMSPCPSIRKRGVHWPLRMHTVACLFTAGRPQGRAVGVRCACGLCTSPKLHLAAPPLSPLGPTPRHGVGSRRAAVPHGRRRLSPHPHQPVLHRSRHATRSRAASIPSLRGASKPPRAASPPHHVSSSRLQHVASSLLRSSFHAARDEWLLAQL